MRKIILSILFISLAIVLAYGSYLFLEEKLEEKKNNEQALENGTPKAIENKTDLWKYYGDEEAGFSIKYPHNVSFNQPTETADFYLSVQATNLNDISEATMGFDKETSLANKESLNKSEYGQEVDWPIKASKKVVRVGDNNAQEFMVLSRFEVCSVVFERKLYFFNNNHMILVTLEIPAEKVLTSMPEYFTTNPENCQEASIWDFDKQSEFYQTLESGSASESVQEWFDLFDQIVGTIEFPLTYSLLIGEWRSLDDPESVIEFAGSKKIDYYAGEKMSEGDYSLDKTRLTVTDDGVFEYEITELSSQFLTMTYLPRGNTLKYEKVE